MAAWSPTDITHFATPAELRKWFAAHHANAQQLWVGFHKKGSGKPSITWPESVDEALCVGWIDGVRKSLGEESYVIRFTPRKPTSIWSVVNVNRVAVLTAEGRMQPAGVAAFEARSHAQMGIYAFEQVASELRCRHSYFQKEQTCMEIFQSAATRLPPPDELASDQRQTRGDASQTVVATHRGVGGGCATYIANYD